MPPMRPIPPRPGSGRQGFTLVELLLVTVILGLLATIVSPYFARARERAIVTQIRADVRQMMVAVETYAALNNGRWPTSITDLEEGGGYTPSGQVEYCFFAAVPRSRWREAYVIAMAGHPRTTTKIFVVYPLWGSRMIEFNNGKMGC